MKNDFDWKFLLIVVVSYTASVLATFAIAWFLLRMAAQLLG